MTPQQNFSILFLGSQMAVGGAQRLLLTKARWFHENGYRVIGAFFYDREGWSEQWQADSPFPLINLDVWRLHGGLDNLFRLGRGLWRLFQLIRRERFTVVETFTYHANVLGLPVAWAAGLPVRVASHHGRLEVMPIWLRWLHNWVINRKIAACLVAVSQRARSEALFEGIHPDRVTVIHNGIDTPGKIVLSEAQRQSLYDELNIHPQQTLVLTVGRLREQKGHTYLLEAIPSVLERFPETVFVLAGDGPLKPALEEKARSLGIERSVRFLGTRLDVPQLLSVADLFVLPSLWEGLPVALLEAMSMGVPCIATAVEGVDEIITDGESGLMLPPADPASLGQAILRLLAEVDLRHKIGSVGRDVVISSYTLDQMCMRYEQLFQELYKGKT